MLGSSPWLLADDPFPHIWAREVFTADAYRELVEHFRRLAGGRERAAFRRATPTYSALSVNFEEISDGPLTVFLTEAWHDLMASCFDVPATGDVEGGLHRHPPDSAPGKVHNDFNPGYFPLPDQHGPPVRPSRRDVCDYKTGGGSVTPVEQVRAVAMLFFLANGQWRPEDGGQLGLYAEHGDRVEAPRVAFSPEDNSLVAFACTPRSYHAYVGDNRRFRNSVIMWLHAPPEAIAERHDISRLVRWR
jgi:hypothetical protein